MPLELSREHVETTLLTWPRRRRLDVEGALGWMGFDESPGTPRFALSRRALVEYLWYALPTKYLAEVEEQLAVAAALGELLEGCDPPGPEYAALCRAPETIAQIHRWEVDREGARRELGRLLGASGTEPPELPDLTWGSIMGLSEALARDAVSARLEDALEKGIFAPGRGSWKAAQRALTEEVLSQQAGSGDPRATWREAIDAERMEAWTGFADRPRHQLCAPVLASLTAPAQLNRPREDGDRGDVIGWLLAVAADTGLPLTAAGALGRAIVRECVARRPAWYPAEWPAPSRETDVAMVHEIAELLNVSKLLRKRKGSWHATQRAKALVDDPIGLRMALLNAHLAGTGFTAAVAELTLCVLLAATRPLEPGELTAEVMPAILADGWRADGQPLNSHWVGRSVYGTVRVLIALDLSDEWADRGPQFGHLTDGGRAYVAHALRTVATAPRVR